MSGDEAQCAWRRGRPHAETEPGVVDVWRAHVRVGERRLRELERMLSPEERARCARLKRGREDFIAARAILRDVLRRYLGVDGNEILFREVDRFGKPVLAGAFDGALRFNVSHSGRLALYAVSGEREVGVDVEAIRDDVEVERIAEQFFSPGEVRTLRTLPQGDRLPAFFRCWTRKEAYVKARGLGLSVQLDSFDALSGEEAEPTAVVIVDAAGGCWRVSDLSVGEGYAGAVAAAGTDWELRWWEWEAP